MNTLYYGDNLPIMRQMAKDSVDLIYLDPSFNSKRTYNLMYKAMTGMPVPESVEAFFDTWELDAEKEQRARDMPKIMLEYGIDDYYVRFWSLWIEALRNTQPHVLAYLIYMVERLLHMRVLLRPTGSIYLHCDTTVSHYIKIMMDAIFGHQNFRNEIIWKRTSAHANVGKRYAVVQDRILFYTQTSIWTWNKPYIPYSDDYTQSHYGQIDVTTKRRFTTRDLTASMQRASSGQLYEWQGIRTTPSRCWAYTKEKMEEFETEGRLVYSSSGMPRLKLYLDEMPGVPCDDIWTDIPPINSQSKDRLGYPTQKPIALLERIIQASSNKDSVVFDPFCGCGTTIYAALKHERQWIGCDIAILPIHLIQHELTEHYRLVEGTHFLIDGIPVSVEQAQTLFQHDPFQFQHWLVERIGGFPMQKKVADRGIDGRIYFDTKSGLKDMVLSVKGGTIHPTDIRDLRGVLERESNAELAGFLSLREPTRGMQEEAATAGMYLYEGVHYPRMQLLTIREILEEKHTFHTPTKIGVKGATGQMSLRI